MIKEFRCFIERDVDGQQVHTRLKDYDTGKYIGIQVLPQNKNKFRDLISSCELFGITYYNPIFDGFEYIYIKGTVVKETEKVVIIQDDENSEWKLI